MEYYDLWGATHKKRHSYTTVRENKSSPEQIKYCLHPSPADMAAKIYLKPFCFVYKNYIK